MVAIQEGTAGSEATLRMTLHGAGVATALVPRRFIVKCQVPEIDVCLATRFLDNDWSGVSLEPDHLLKPLSVYCAMSLLGS